MKVIWSTKTGKYVFYCPGCKAHHYFDLKRWKWNGSFVFPTVTPSIIVHKGGRNKEECHLKLKTGKITYLKSCSHKLKNQTISMIANDEKFKS